jgi:hypothetical protein
MIRVIKGRTLPIKVSRVKTLSREVSGVIIKQEK